MRDLRQEFLTGQSAGPLPAPLAVGLRRMMAYHVQCGLLCSMVHGESREKSRPESHEELGEEEQEEEQEEEREWRHMPSEGKASWRSCGVR